ncbi:hypothetical protein L1049_015002 [Liquidambar formosana]|uniref:Uncharacterized protein n=1 Tax=Liquidambar formosana TaxID=63359 RepID=A0AAP0RXE4_LIQFO
MKQQQEETDSHQECFSKDLTSKDIEAAKKTKPTRKVTARFFAAVISMLMLLLGIYTGHRVETEPKHQLVFSTGVEYFLMGTEADTKLFGWIYFIPGLAILRELTLDWLQQKETRKLSVTLVSAFEDFYSH